MIQLTSSKNSSLAVHPEINVVRFCNVSTIKQAMMSEFRMGLSSNRVENRMPIKVTGWVSWH